MKTNRLNIGAVRLIAVILLIFVSAAYIMFFSALLESDSSMAGIITNIDDQPTAADAVGSATVKHESDHVDTTAPEKNDPPMTEPDTSPPETDNQHDTTYADTQPPENPDTQSREALLTITDDAGDDYLCEIIFLGDSTTYGLLYYEMLDGGRDSTQVWTPKARTFTLSRVNYDKILYPDDGCEYVVKEAVELKKPATMIITLGVNGVSFMDENAFIKSYEKLINDIKEVSPDTKIILQSIFPVAVHYDKQVQINNEKISTANGWIIKIAENNGVKYLDTYSALIGDDGYLPEKYQNGDGMHLNKEAFAVVLNYIRTHAYK